jgi:tetratricopeptide (TPR) repeat protein
MRVTGGAPRTAARRDDFPTPGEGKPVASAGEAAAKRASRATGASAKPLFVAKPTALSALDAAYAALTEDRLDEARIAYRKALESNPGERDALLGLAYIAQRQGNIDEARAHYQQVLRQEPGHPGANAGLLAIASDGDLQGAASRAREMAERTPDSAAVLSTLGGILAKEGRIAEAQQAYFKALTLEPDNAFHAYNLAVGLDRLHKYSQAISYYRRALAIEEKAGAGDRAGFPRNEALRRLEQLTAADSGARSQSLPESRAR